MWLLIKTNSHRTRRHRKNRITILIAFLIFMQNHLNSDLSQQHNPEKVLSNYRYYNMIYSDLQDSDRLCGTWIGFVAFMGLTSVYNSGVLLSEATRFEYGGVNDGRSDWCCVNRCRSMLQATRRRERPEINELYAQTGDDAFSSVPRSVYCSGIFTNTVFKSAIPSVIFDTISERILHF